MKDKASLNAVDAALTRPGMRDRGKFVNDLVEICFHFRGWVQGCPCHEEERKQHKKVECPLAGCRLPELQGKSEEVVQQLTTSSGEVDVSVPFYVEAINAYRHGAGFLKAKAGFVYDAPYTLARARDPVKAAACLEAYRSTPGQHHRVEEEFCGPDGPWHDDMVAHAAGEGLSDDLDSAIKSIEVIPISEEPAEGYHKNVTEALSKACASKYPWWAASLRLSENIHITQCYCHSKENQEYSRLWRTYQQIAQRQKPFTRPARMPLKKLLRFVYHLGDGVLDSAAKGTTVSGWLESIDYDEAPEPDDDDQDVVQDQESLSFQEEALRARSDALRYFMKAGNYYSLPGREGETFLHVISFLESGMRFVKTKKFKKRRLPTLVATLEQWNPAAAAPDTADVFSVSDPEIEEGCGLATWSVLQNRMRLWQATVSDVAGCMHLHSPRKAFRDLSREELLSQDAPVLSILEALQRAAWMTGVATGVHLPANEKVVDSRKMRSKRLYFQCLLCL